MHAAEGPEAESRRDMRSLPAPTTRALSVPDANESRAPSPANQAWLFGLIAATLAWVLLLVGLVNWTANPVTLNRVQIAHADYVVTATPIDVAKGTFQVEREWKQGAELGAIRIHNLPPTPSLERREYLIPLSRRADGSFVITHGELSNPGHEKMVAAHVPPVIYPATPDALRQLEALLRSSKSAKP